MNIKEITPYVKQAEHPITTQADLVQATALLSELNRYMDSLTEHKERKTKPLLQGLKEIREDYRERENLLKNAIEQVRTNLTSYAQAQAIARQEEESRILKDKRTTPDTKMTKLANVLPETTGVETEHGKITFTTITKYRLVSTGDIPLHLLEINLSALKDYLKQGNPLPKGIEVYEEQSLRNYRA